MFTPIETTIGALLLFQSTTTLLLTTGQPLGASSLLGTLPSSPSPTIAGILIASAAMSRFAPGLLPSTTASAAMGTERYLLSALLVGAGTKAANGCTSGHLLCGVPHLSVRSLVASAVFFVTAAATATASSYYWGTTTPRCNGAPCHVLVYPSAERVATLLSVLAASSVVSAGMFLLPKCSWSRAAVRVWCGATFAMGLAVSGMADAGKPLGFLTFRREYWDPSLVMVVVGSVVPAMAAWRWGMRGVGVPVLGGEWMVRGKEVGWRLVAGSALFGVGWGAGGVCPGPGVVAMGRGLLGGEEGVVGAAWAWAWAGCFLVGWWGMRWGMGVGGGR